MPARRRRRAATRCLSGRGTGVGTLGEEVQGGDGGRPRGQGGRWPAEVAGGEGGAGGGQGLRE